MWVLGTTVTNTVLTWFSTTRSCRKTLRRGPDLKVRLVNAARIFQTHYNTYQESRVMNAVMNNAKRVLCIKIRKSLSGVVGQDYEVSVNMVKRDETHALHRYYGESSAHNTAINHQLISGHGEEENGKSVKRKVSNGVVWECRERTVDKGALCEMWS